MIMQNALLSLTTKEPKDSEFLPSLPEHRVVGNKKAQLHKDVLFFERQKISFRDKIEANTTGKQYVKTLMNVLWYVDGHQHKLKAFSVSLMLSKPFPTTMTLFELLPCVSPLSPSHDPSFIVREGITLSSPVEFAY